MSRGRVYEDLPRELFATSLPGWPLSGETMSYTHDRSLGTRGVGAVAANDLREGRGGAVVRTGRGPVTIVRKPASLGALAFKKEVVKKPITTWWSNVPKLPPKRRVSAMGKKILTARAVASSPLMIHPGVTMVVPPPAPSATPYPPAVSPTTTGYGGGGGSWSSGGGWKAPADEFANELAPSAAAPAEAPVEPSAEKKPMSTGTKVVLGLGIAGLLFSTFMKGA